MNQRRCTGPSRVEHGRTMLLVAVAIGVSIASAACGKDAPRTTSSGAGPSLSSEAIRGRDVAQRSGCVNCHSIDGTPNVGPSWVGVWGTKVSFTDGRTATVNDAYLRRAIVDPAADQLTGFASTMPRFSLSEDELDAVIAYIKELTPTTAPRSRP